MKLPLLILLASAIAWPAEIKYARQDRVMLLAYVDGAPASIALYRAMACGNGTGEERFSPDLVPFMANDYGAVQDPDAALFAAQEARKKGKRYKLVSLVIEGITYAGIAVAAAGTGGVIVLPEAVGLLVGAGAAATPRLLRRREELARQPVPANWLLSQMTERLLRPGGPCEPFLLAMSASTPETFRAVTEPRLVRDVPAAPPTPAAVPRVLEPPETNTSGSAETPSLPSRTAPLTSTSVVFSWDPEVDQVARLIHARNAELLRSAGATQ